MNRITKCEFKFLKIKDLKQKNMKDDNSIVFCNSPQSNFLVIKKISLMRFIFWELLVFYLISLASFFTVYISTDLFASEEKFEKVILLNIAYFKMNNLVMTSLGLFIVMGIVCFVNKLTSNSELPIQGLLDRLITSVVDFYYLMFSTVLGCVFAMLIFLNMTDANINENSFQVAKNSTLLLATLGALSAVTMRYFIKQDEVISKK